jgi:hypothetical protein
MVNSQWQIPNTVQLKHIAIKIFYEFHCENLFCSEHRNNFN